MTLKMIIVFTIFGLPNDTVDGKKSCNPCDANIGIYTISTGSPAFFHSQYDLRFDPGGMSPGKTYDDLET